MISIKDKATAMAVKKMIHYVEKDPDQNMGKILNWLEHFDTEGSITKQLYTARKALADPDNNWVKLVKSLYTDIDTEVRKTMFENFVMNSVIISDKRKQEVVKQYHCNVPWAILLDPTSACNLKCIGCWASEYGKQLNLTLEELDTIITQGKELGIYMYLYTGGEPMVRKHDVMELCRRHPDCVFLAFTNGTLIDEAFANEMLKVKNFIPAISIEGDESATDQRRGKGTYQKVIQAMAILKEKHLPFGASCCYTSKNVDSISDESFIDSLVDFGAKFAWFFHYMPIGNDAVLDLLCTPTQRSLMYHRIRHYRSTKPIFTIDFQNDGEYVGGCIAGGRNYLHINPNGDVEPCAFIHYSDSNIREKTLLEALCSPLFMAYKEGQPFNKNHLRPCPMLENPEKLMAMVHATGAHSTDLLSEEPVDHLCGKCKNYAANWAPVADILWKDSHKE